MRHLVLATFALVTVTSRLAVAHIALQSPPPRFNQNTLKTAPCGSGTRSGVVTPLSAGQTLTVKWKETVSHSGHFRIALSAKDSDFQEPTSLTIPTTLAAWDLADGIPDKTGTQTYEQTVQIPTTPCTSCVLQLLQIMGSGTDGTNNGPFSGVYHECADVSITVGSTDAGVSVEVGRPADAPSVVDLSVDRSGSLSEVAGDAIASGGVLATGGMVGTGGAMATGGLVATGGVFFTGGALSTGGAPTTGGAMVTGGSVGTGGFATVTSGGLLGTGGASGGSHAQGGVLGSGGVASGGTGGGATVVNQTSAGCQLGSSRISSAWPMLVGLGLFGWGSWRRRVRRG